MRRGLCLLVAIAAAGASACGGAVGRGSPASASVRELVAALRADDAHRAYDLLSGDVRKAVSYDEFALQWKQSKAEREWQARVLEDSLRGDPDVGERALASYSDGKMVALEREGKAWRLESALVSHSKASRPRDAIRMFAEALAHDDLDGLLRTLTTRRRDGLRTQVEGFLKGLEKRIDDKIDEIGADRAELRWDENDIQYRIVLRKEDGEWRVDDIHVRPAEPKEEEGEVDGVEGGVIDF
ncbi:MAG: hypothetical protein H6708_06490 [Kofleriaceae bacterium]|nr:hypothetical protein [Myxococcales bacterium]MCB9560040.1 hypothetical protein [Kofleriaceae bacterium]